MCYLLLGCSVAGSSGCVLDRWWVKSPPLSQDRDSLVLQGDRLEPEVLPVEGTGAGDLAAAHEVYRRGEYGYAEKLFHRVADNTKNSPQIAEEARYYEAECLRREGHYPKAADTYYKMLTDTPGGGYRDQALQRMFDIANYWLDDTRKEMELHKEKMDGKRWWVMPAVVRFDRTKPFFDEEGRALEKLQQVHWNDIRGPLADKALFLAGSVKFFREDYREADHYFTQLIEQHPNSDMAPQALELAIIAKHMGTGGSDYDGRKVAEARQLIDTALRAYPQLATKKGDFLSRQLYSVNMQQAEKDYKIAEFYRRTGHPGSAYFYYEIVRRRYPGTSYFDKATERMLALRQDLEKADEKAPAVPPPADPSPAPRPGSPPGNLPFAPEVAPQPRTLP